MCVCVCVYCWSRRRSVLRFVSAQFSCSFFEYLISFLALPGTVCLLCVCSSVRVCVCVWRVQFFNKNKFSGQPAAHMASEIKLFRCVLCQSGPLPCAARSERKRFIISRFAVDRNMWSCTAGRGSCPGGCTGRRAGYHLTGLSGQQRQQNPLALPLPCL